MAAIPFPRENKLKAFFRSRSRSRSRSQPPDPPDSPPHPSNARPRHTRDAPSSSDNPPSSYLKSPVRSQNRPISSTTTATHSTITPLPSDCLRNRGRHAYAYQPHNTDTHIHDHDQYGATSDYDSDDNNLPRSQTPSGSSTRRKLAWHSFFGIALARKSSSSTSIPPPPTNRKGSTSTSASEPKARSTRKRSFRLTSRPSTPKSVDSSSKSPYSIPTPSSPLPLSASPRRRSFGLGNSQRSTPKSSTGHLPLPHVQTPQPGRSHGRRHSVGSERPPHDSAVALPEEHSHRTVHKHASDSRNKGKEKENSLAESERPPDDLLPFFDFPPQALSFDPAPTSRTYLSPHFPRHPAFSNLATVDSASSEENEQSPHRLHVIPQIIHTPPTPQRPGEEVDSSPHPSYGKDEPAKGKTVAVAHREQVLVSSSQSHADPHHTPSSKGRFTPRFLSTKDAPRRSPAVSYDGPAHKTSLARNMTSHRGKLGSFDFERPVSAFNRSSSTVDQQKSHTSPDNSSHSKAHLPSLERTTSNDSARVGKIRLIATGRAGSPTPPQLNPDHTGSTSVISFSSVSLQTRSTGKDAGSNTPASSSWGRASGRRVLRTSHGTFAFEPSSLPSTPNPHTFNLPNEPNQGDRRGQTTGLPRSQPTTPLHAIFDARGKHSRGQSYNAPNDPSRSNPGERKPKGRGRSFDLGLGLSWAPSRLREEVLMPGSILTREKAKVGKSRANGVDVTRTFESLLSESQFQTFKKHVRRFDAHAIPLDGPSGLLARVENLLAESGLGEQERSRLLTEFSLFVENHGG